MKEVTQEDPAEIWYLMSFEKKINLSNPEKISIFSLSPLNKKKYFKNNADESMHNSSEYLVNSSC